jgi:hypothetical protein
METGVTERIVVTLIHGTFARDAPWTKEESELCKAVNGAFQGRVEFRRFCWSGGNTLDARRAAAADLRTQLRKDKVPPARHFVVAHSHGGNIALYALRDPEVRKRIAGVATLATPFLIARKRDLGVGSSSLLIAGLVPWFWLAGDLISRFIWPSAGLLPLVVAGIFFMLSAALIGLREWGADKLAEDLELTTPAQGRLWIARMSGDEATAGLQTAHFAGTIVAQIQLFFVRANEWAERSGASSWQTSVWRVAAGLAVAVLFWAVGTLFGVDDRSAPVLWGFIVGIAIGALIILWGLLPQAPRVMMPFAAGLVLPLALALTIPLFLAFGREVAFYSFLLETRTEATPLGDWKSPLFDPVRSYTGGREAAPGLTHSWIYDQPDVLAALTTWMKECPALIGVEPSPSRSS